MTIDRQFVGFNAHPSSIAAPSAARHGASVSERIALGTLRLCGIRRCRSSSPTTTTPASSSAAINSALAQDDDGIDVEVIVVDDGSTDDSLSVIEGFADRVTTVATANNGQGAAFNNGFAASHGDVVIFLDADDVLWKGTARRVIERMSADPAIVRVQFPLDVIDATGRPTGEIVPEPPKVLFAGDARPRLLTCPDDIVWQPTSGNAFRRDALAAVLPMPEPPFRICADYYLSNLVPLHGSVEALDDAGGGYRVHGSNAHYSRAESGERLRTNIRRTCETHRCLIDEAHRIGLDHLPEDPATVRSVTFAANRIISLRLDPSEHPIDGDTRRSLVRLGWSSAAARTDVSPLRRVAFAAWFLAVAVVPRRLLRTAARPFTVLDEPAVKAAKAA